MVGDEVEMVTEVAKTTGKIVDAATALGNFMEPFVRPPLEHLSGVLSDKLIFARREGASRFIEKAKRSMKERGIEYPTRRLPLAVAIPLLQAASMEEDDFLQNIWVQMLVNATNAKNDVELKRLHISIMENLTPVEVGILDKLYSASHGDLSLIFSTYKLPFDLVSSDEKIDIGTVAYDGSCQIALWNLRRLGCINEESFWGSSNVIAQVSLTSLGDSFVRACLV